MLEFIIALPIGAIVGWIIREVVSDKLARDRALEIFKVTEFKTAVGKFRGAFAPAQAKYPLIKNNEIDAMLWEELTRQAIAIEEFRHYVPPGKKDDYQKAWDNYHRVAGSVRFFDYYMGDNPSKIFDERIHAILQFTE